MKILITSGGTKEYIDSVRVLTNISTGKLGALIADTIIYNWPCVNIDTYDLDINFVYVKGSKLPKYTPINLYEVTDVKSVYETMRKLVPDMDVVIHPMAVSDFGFRPSNIKLKSNDPDAFIESLRERIYKTPKILAKIKEWNPKCFLISFKFENNLKHDDLISKAFESMLDNNCDLVIANDKEEMVRNNDHVSYFCRKPDLTEKVVGKKEIADKIFEIIHRD